MKKLDLNNWERKEIYDYMSSIPDPFYTVSFNIDVTNVYEYAHRRNISFYYSLVFLATQAINDVPAFLNDILDGEVVVLNRRSPSICDIHENSEAFFFVDLLLGNDIVDFCERARRESLASISLFPKNSPQNEAWIYFSCIPWIDMTCVTNERAYDKDDTIPRISWGRYSDCGEKKVLNISMELNHRLIDGFHIGQFEKHLADRIRALGC